MNDNSLQQGVDFYKQKRYNEALAFFLAAAADENATSYDNVEIAYYLGLCYARLSYYEDALLYLEQVVTTGKDDERINQCRLALAVIYDLSGRKKLSSFELNKLLEVNYKPSEVYSALAYISWESGDVEKSIEYYEKALSLEPESVTAMNGLGYVLACENKDLPRALTLCRKAVEYSQSAACLDSLGWVYFKLGLNDDAKKYLGEASEKNPNNSIIQEHLSALNGGEK